MFFAFSTSVMRTFGALPPAQGIAAMQKLNVLIINPWFLGVFVGTAGLCMVVAVVTFVVWPDTGTVARVDGLEPHTGPGRLRLPRRRTRRLSPPRRGYVAGMHRSRAGAPPGSPDAAVGTGPVALEPRRERHCAECASGPLPLLVLADGAPRCLDCAGLGHLVYLPRGDTALTRRAREASSLSVVVVRYDRRRRRHERQGVLVEEAALALAGRRCHADAEARARRRERDAARRAEEDVRFTAAFAVEIRTLFPGCPAERAGHIAAHASRRGSGRVGRTAAGRALDAGAVTAAVRAAVRHDDTEYDALLTTGMPRAAARRQVTAAVERVLERWRGEAHDRADETKTRTKTKTKTKEEETGPSRTSSTGRRTRRTEAGLEGPEL